MQTVRPRASVYLGRMLHSRKLVAVSLVLLAAKVVLTARSAAPGSVLAGSIEVAIGILTTVAFVQAGRRSAGFARQFWFLLSTAFGSWAASHVAIVYQRDLQHFPDYNYWPSVILFFVFGIPFALALFLESDRRGDSVRWQETLDFAQVGIVMLAVFLAFAYVPYLQDPSRRVVMSRSLGWHMARDSALTIAFVVRSIFSRSAEVRRLFRRITLFLVIYSAEAALFFYVVAHSGTRHEPAMDVLSDMVRVAAILIAATWNETAPSGVAAGAISFRGNFLWAQLVPFPLLVLVMVPRIAAVSPGVAWLVTACSFACLSGRFVVTQQAAQRSTERLRRSEARFRRLAEGVSEGSGEKVFQSLVLHACEATGAAYALVGELKPGSADLVKTLALCKQGALLANTEYRLKGTPCENVVGKQLCHYAANVAELFPEDQMLGQMGVQAYMGTPLYAGSGNVLGIFVLLNDRPFADPEMTRSIIQICATRAAAELERVRAYEGLRDSEQKLSLTFKLSPSPMLFASWGRHEAIHDGVPHKAYLRLLAVSDSFVSFYGAPEEEIIGRNLRQLGMLFNDVQAQRIVDALESRGMFHDLELTSRTRRGEVRMVVASGQLVHLGGERFLLATFRDVTFQRMAQKALEENETKYRDLFENANDLIFTLDFRGKFLALNRVGRRVCGLPPDDVESRKFESLLDEPSRKIFQEQFARVLQNEEPAVFEVTTEKRRRNASVLEVSLRMIRKNGSPFGVQGIARDVTERRLLERKLLQSQRLEAVGTLAAGVAHDFNNLLTVITGYAQLAQDKSGAGGGATEELEEILQATRRASSLTNQLLAFSRKQVSQPRVLDLNDSIRNLEKMLRRLIGDDVRLETNLDPASALVWADPVQVDQILMNLSANARDAMPSGGTLRFSTSNLKIKAPDGRLNLVAGDYATLVVADTGTGMDEATMGRVFEPFFTTKAVGKGTGLGLATVYGIVQQGGGQIAVASELGRGTTFTIYFPAARGKGAARAPEQLDTSIRGTETILLVEDDPALRSLAHKLLESAGYLVYCAGNVQAAERLWSEVGNQIDLIVTDVVMADGGGVGLVSKTAKTNPRTRVLFISGYTDGRISQENLTEGHASFLAKPFQPAQLARKVREVLDWKQPLAANEGP